MPGNRGQKSRRPDKPGQGERNYSIHLPGDTQGAIQWKGKVDNIECASRSLSLDRYANPDWKNEARRDFFESALDKKNSEAEIFLQSWLKDICPRGRLGVPDGGLYFAKLQSRMMVNMAGGVMENAGLCLDRFSGEPYIPGSAVKGCARRMAIQELLDAPDEQKLELLIKIALTFGWGAQDWKTKEDFKQDWEKERSDFAFALGDRLWNRTFVREIKARLWQEVFGNDFSSENFDRQLGHFAGRGQFLPAHPTATCSLELDVLTCHHQKYYQGEPDFEVAPDTEDPGPVIFFPAVAPGNSFVFAVIAQDDQAVNWLKKGLKWFGIGAKTNAGYGWFLPDEERQQKFAEEADARRRREAVKEMPETEIKQGVNQFSALSDNEIRAKINELRHRTDYSRPEIRILLQTLIGPKRSILENIRSSGTRPDRKRLEALEEAAKVLGVDLS